MIKNFVNEFNLIENYSHKVVIIITHWDKSVEPDRDSEAICKAFKDYCKKTVFYSSKETDSNRMADLMYSFISHLEAKKRNFIVEKIINFYFKRKRCTKTNEGFLTTYQPNILQMILILISIFVVLMAFKKDFSVELNLVKV